MLRNRAECRYSLGGDAVVVAGDCDSAVASKAASSSARALFMPPALWYGSPPLLGRRRFDELRVR